MPELVLVIEDEKEIRDLVKYNLERAGFRVATAADGEQGLEAAYSSRPDALVLDLMLPGRSGLELLAFLAHQPGRVCSREELLRKVWGYDYLGETRTVDVHVRRLRVKLGETHRVIETVTGAGYKLASQPASSGG